MTQIDSEARSVPSLLGFEKLVAFVPATDAARALAFYRDVLGLRLVSEEMPFALVFDVNGTMLRVTLVQDFAPAKYTVLGWDVPDITATVTELRLSGIVLERFGFLEQDALGIWSAPGEAKIAWFKDPDGNTLSITEFPR